MSSSRSRLPSHGGRAHYHNPIVATSENVDLTARVRTADHYRRHARTMLFVLFRSIISASGGKERRRMGSLLLSIESDRLFVEAKQPVFAIAVLELTPTICTRDCFRRCAWVKVEF